jgi:thymidylate kinase
VPALRANRLERINHPLQAMQMRKPSKLPIMLSFSGVDGAGKSTQIDALIAFLGEIGVSYRLYRFWDDVVALAAFREKLSRRVFKGDQGVGSPANPIARRDKNVTTWYATLMRFVLYGLDTIKLRSFVRSLRQSADVIIFDRYLYDELANLPMDNKLTRFYIRAILRLMPAPDLALLLDADPELAIRRKPEYPLEFVKRNRETYMALSRIARIVVIPPSGIHRTAETIRSLICSQGLQPGQPPVSELM